MWSVPDVKHVSGTDHMILACPARFERATYALEALKMSSNNRSNDNKVLRTGVILAPRTLAWDGMPWGQGGIRRQLDV